MIVFQTRENPTFLKEPYINHAISGIFFYSIFYSVSEEVNANYVLHTHLVEQPTMNTTYISRQYRRKYAATNFQGKFKMACKSKEL